MADFQDPKELERYLKTAAELECAAYRLEKSIGAANGKLMPLYEEDPTRYIFEPRLIEVEPPKPSYKPSVSENEADERKATIGYVWLLVRLISWCVLGVWLIASFRVLRVYLGIAIFIVTFIRYWINVKGNSPSDLRKKKEEYEKKLLQYEEALPRYEEEKAARQAEYEKKIEEYNKDIKEAKKFHQKKIRAVQNGISKMKKTLGEIKDTLENLYAMNIVHPKYRNMVAMCSICEYFETGRCTSLKGADGAYNLYEAELRQNLIISRLDTIIDKLDDIKSGQYMLYCELKETNRILRSISSEVANIASATDSIAQTSSITAVCTQATAKNTEALKYIALVS